VTPTHPGRRGTLCTMLKTHLAGALLLLAATAAAQPTAAEALQGLALPLDLSAYAVVEPLVAERVTGFAAAPDLALDDTLDNAALIVTTRGPILVDLYETETPLTVNNFVFLALHRFYDGIVFHRVIDEFMAQTGDPTGTGRGDPGYRFADEFVPALLHDRPGILSMANSGPGTNGSQFFLTFVPTPWLDGRHTVFGAVTEGLDVLDRITRIEPGGQQQPIDIFFLSADAADARAAGYDIAGDGTIAEALPALLGTEPQPGSVYAFGEYDLRIGTAQGEPALGIFARASEPDAMTQVFVLTRPRP
jgi:cyclophilin family peptidyl-prolyl cis-trans isomerase